MPLGLHRASILQVVRKTLAHVLLSCVCCHVPIVLRGCQVGTYFSFSSMTCHSPALTLRSYSPSANVMVSGRVGLGSITLLALFYFILSNFLFKFYLLCPIIM